MKFLILYFVTRSPRLAVNAFSVFGLFFVYLVSAQAEEISDLILEKLRFQVASSKVSRSFVEMRRGLKLVAAEDLNPNSMDEIVFPAAPPGGDVFVPIVFDLNSSELRLDQFDRILPVCDAMARLESAHFRVIGHTDASGNEPYNDGLSVLRANSVASFIKNECGISRSRLQVIGVGERYLADVSNPFEEVNRRVEFQAFAK